MSVGLNFLVKLSLLCKEELSRSGRKGAVKQPGELTANSVCGKSILKSDQNDRRSRRLNHVRFEDDSSEKDVPKRQICDSKTCSEPPAGLADPPVKPERNDLDSDMENYCALCKLAFRRPQTYMMHLLTDRHLGLIRCETCTKKVSYNEMENHMNTVHLTSSFVFKTLKRLDDGHFRCTKCDCIFLKFHQYRKHVGSQAHKGIMCRRCNFRSQSAEDLEKHSQEVHGNQKTYFCKLCGAAYISELGLEKHTETAHSVHTCKKSFSCSVCGVIFTRQDNLVRHVAEIHTVPRPFPCDKCALSFKHRRNLVQHMRVHTKGRHQCTFCFKSFEDKIDLENHEKTHLGKLFNCMVCGESFEKYSRRERHVLKHLNPKPTRKQRKKEEATRLKVDDSFSECSSSVLSSSSEENAPSETFHRENKGHVKLGNVGLQKGQKLMNHSGNQEKHSYSEENLLVPLPHSKNVMTSHNVSEHVKRVGSCKTEASEATVKTVTSTAKNRNKIPSNVLQIKERMESSSKKASVTLREHVGKLQDPSEKGGKDRLPPVLEIKDGNVSCDRICKGTVEKNTRIFSVKKLENSSVSKDVPSGRTQSKTAEDVCSGKRNYANAFEKDLRQVPTLELPVKRRKKNYASKENSPVLEMKCVNIEKESFSDRLNSPAVIFQECKLNRSKSLNQTENLPQISKSGKNISPRSIVEEKNVCLAENNRKSGRRLGTNNFIASLQSSEVPQNSVRKVPKVKSNDLDKICDSNINKACENADFPQTLGIGECCSTESQSLRTQEDGWSKKNGIFMELKGDDLIVIDRPYDICEALVNYNANVIDIDRATWSMDPSTVEKAVFIDASSLTQIDDLVAIPVTELEPFATVYTVPDTDSGVSVLNAENVILDKVFTFTASDECIETPVTYSLKTVKAVSETPPKKRTKRESKRSKKSNCANVKEKKVLVKNLCTGSDDFCLPEFIIEEDSE